MSDVPFMPADPEQAGFATHAIACACIPCQQRRLGARARHAHLGDIEHLGSVAVPEHSAGRGGIYIDGHQVHVGEDWNDD